MSNTTQTGSSSEQPTRQTATPVERLRLEDFSFDIFYEIWVITLPLDASSPPHFLIALRRPTQPTMTAFRITQDESFPCGCILRFDHGAEFADSRFSSWRGVGIFKGRHMENFFRTLLDVPLKPNNEWILTFLCRLEKFNFISKGKTLEWLQACGQYERYRLFWELTDASRQRRFLPGMSRYRHHIGKESNRILHFSDY
jgi:hypothetical protein